MRRKFRSLNSLFCCEAALPHQYTFASWNPLSYKSILKRSSKCPCSICPPLYHILENFCSSLIAFQNNLKFLLSQILTSLEHSTLYTDIKKENECNFPSFPSIFVTTVSSSLSSPISPSAKANFLLQHRIGNSTSVKGIF